MNKLVKHFALLGMAVALVWASFPNEAQAIPNFARKTGLVCAKCHASFPKLNAFGREFFRNGYVRTGEQEPQHELSETLGLEKNLWGGLIKLRPYDKKRSGGAKIRSLHELELFFAGTSGGSLGNGFLGNNLSFWSEIKAEDESDFDIELENVEVGYHLIPELAIVAGNRSLAESDPFQTISNHGRTTISKRTMFRDFGSGNSLSEKQNFGVQGWINNMIWYAARVGADNGDPEGEGNEDIATRLAVSLMDGGLTFGSFWSAGQQAAVDSEDQLNFWRYVADAMLDMEDGTVILAYQHTNDDVGVESREDNDAFYVEGAYYLRRDGNPFIVPTVRWDFYQENDGKDDFNSLTVNLAAYVRENIKALFEYWQEIDRPDDADDEYRFTFQVEVGV